MNYFTWSAEKNEHLKNERDVSFEQIIMHLEGGYLHDVLENPNQNKYGNQKILMVELNNYIYLVPFVEQDEYVF